MFVTGSKDFHNFMDICLVYHDTAYPFEEGIFVLQNFDNDPLTILVSLFHTSCCV